MQRNKNNYWNLCAKKEHTHEEYLHKDELISFNEEMNKRISALEEATTYSRKRLKKVRRLRRSMI